MILTAFGLASNWFGTDLGWITDWRWYVATWFPIAFQSVWQNSHWFWSVFDRISHPFLNDSPSFSHWIWASSSESPLVLNYCWPDSPLGWEGFCGCFLYACFPSFLWLPMVFQLVCPHLTDLACCSLFSVIIADTAPLSILYAFTCIHTYIYIYR